jgi:hypothetical protein
MKNKNMETTGTINISGISNSSINISRRPNGTTVNTDLTTFSAKLFNYFGSPEMVSTKEVGETIEIIYKTKSMICCYPLPTPYKIYKIVYSCIDGKWNKSEPIYGKIIPAQEEYFEFDKEK